MRVSTILLTDFYKTIHHLAYVEGMDYLVSYWTPRMSRVESVDKVVMFGLQAFLKKYLIKEFNETFFNRPKEEVMEEYRKFITFTMSEQASDTKHLEELHDLGYLPISIKAVAEGTKVNIKTPMFEISNTLKGYGWLVNYIETLVSVNVWHTLTSATTAYEYRKIVNEFFDKTVSNKSYMEVKSKDEGAFYHHLEKGVTLPTSKNTAVGDFSMRGMTSPDSAMASGAAHLTSFIGTATMSSILWLEEYYNADYTKEVVGKGVPSTEHSVMSSYGKDGEFDCYKRLITEVFPKGILSIVSDTYDYWNVLTNYLPILREDILARDGKIVIRGDSGDPVDIICGKFTENTENIVARTNEDIKKHFIRKAKDAVNKGYIYADEFEYYARVNSDYFKVTIEMEMDEDTNYECTTGDIECIEVERVKLNHEQKGTVEILWDVFGGYINEKGYKVLNPKIGAIYGDSITPERAKEIYNRLEKKGFAASNVTLGAGSYTYQYVTRDTFGMALKATHSVVDGVERQIFKDPKTDNDRFKKSQKGMCYVYQSGGDILYQDCLSKKEIEEKKNNLLVEVFNDSKVVKEYTLKEIRERLHKSEF